MCVVLLLYVFHFFFNLFKPLIMQNFKVCLDCCIICSCLELNPPICCSYWLILIVGFFMLLYNLPLELLFFKCFLMFVYLWDRHRAWAGEGQRERETDSEAGSRLWAVSTESDTGLKPMNREIVTWAKVGHSTDWTTQAPPSCFFFFFFKVKQTGLLASFFFFF